MTSFTYGINNNDGVVFIKFHYWSYENILEAFNENG